MVTQLEPIRDIWGAGRLAQSIRQKEQDVETSRLRDLQTQSAELGIEKQRLDIGQAQTKQRQAQADRLIIDEFREASKNKSEDISFSTFGAQFFQEKGRPDLAQGMIERIGKQIDIVGKTDGQAAVNLYNRDLLPIIGGQPAKYIGKSQYGEVVEFTNEQGKKQLMVQDKKTGDFKEAAGLEGLRVVQPAGKTPEQVDREIRAKERGLDLRESELANTQAETLRKAGELKPTMQKILDTAQTAAFDSEKTANEFELLIDDYTSSAFEGGVKATFSEFLKDTLGTQDEESLLRRKFRGIRASQATKNLPPGPASDKDIALAISGFPPDNAPAHIIASFLTGAAKIARIDQAFQTFKAEHISEQGSSAGMIKAWRENKGIVIQEALRDFEEGHIPGGTIIMRHQTLGDVYEDDVRATMKKHNLTREEVLRRLGAQ
ncbi:MAG: hypothetical protein GY800_09060 [Planctomycetes bacterium]|nr:hypothetical protein [Planctomycetota bacterium]